MNKEKKYCIYSIVDLRTDQIIYVGKTYDFVKRKRAHFTDDRRHVDKYMYEEGRDNFEMNVVLDNIETNDEAVRLEDTYILEYQPNMNKCRSGHIEKDDPNGYMREYNKSDKQRNYYKDYHNTEKYREYQRQYYHRKKAEKQQMGLDN